jgi:hypothetical protein
MRRRPVGWDLFALATLLVLVGVGSALWHITAEPWAQALDLLPIFLFMFAYLGVFLRRVFEAGRGQTVAWLGLFLGANVAGQRALPQDLLNGSLVYAPASAALLILAAAAFGGHRRAGASLLEGWILLNLALVFRTVDPILCPIVPVGTHFLWHATVAAACAVMLPALPV